MPAICCLSNMAEPHCVWDNGRHPDDVFVAAMRQTARVTLVCDGGKTFRAHEPVLITWWVLRGRLTHAIHQNSGLRLQVLQVRSASTLHHRCGPARWLKLQDTL